MDLHTTNGSLHGYSLTYAPTLSPAAVTVGPYLFDKMMPEIRKRVRERQGFEMFDYGGFQSTAGRGGGGGRGRGGSLETIVADSIPSGGWQFVTYEALPRYGANYVGLRGRLSILSEAFSHDPFSRRIASTYAFVGEILSYVAQNSKEILALHRDHDTKVAGWAARPSSSPQIGLRSRMDTTRIEDVRVEMLVPLTDTTKRELGMRSGQMRTGIIKLVRMPVLASFEPTVTNTLPFAYAFSGPAADSLLGILAIHGVQVEQLDAAATASVQAFTVDTIINRPRNETPRDLREVRGRWKPASTQTLPARSYVVKAGQQLGLLAFYLLEPQSDDGLYTYLTGVLEQGKDYPITRITAPVTLRSHIVR
jgi:hypothetical protein